MPPKYWRVVGGADKGGIVVRKGQTLSSEAYVGRLSTDAWIEELQLVGERLNYKKRTGNGPNEGWVSTKIKGAVLVVPENGQDTEPILKNGTPKGEYNGRAPHVTSTSGNNGKNDDKETILDKPVCDAVCQNQRGEKTAEREKPIAADDSKVNGSTPDEPMWIQNSRRKMAAFHNKEKVLPPTADQLIIPERLKGKHPRERLSPFKRLSPAEMEKMSAKNCPGDFSGRKFPHTSEQLRDFGPEWYTNAFHSFGTLPKDNRVKRVVSVEQLPHSGFDAAGGAGHKALVTVEYEKPDPNLHTDLFAKFPWDFFESDSGKTYRLQLSTYTDSDSQELLANMCCEHLFPFSIPKLYFCDISRESTNYILICERIPFGKRGRIEKGKVVEKIARNPYEIWPVCGKYQDHLLEDPPLIYFCIFREMAHLAAWDQQGHFDSYFGGPLIKFGPEGYLMHLNKKPVKKKMVEVRKSASELLLKKGFDFATKIAPQIFTSTGKDPKLLKKMTEEITAMAPHFDDIRNFTSNNSDFTGAMHLNLQADNAFFWLGEHSALDCGVFDWSGFNRSAFVSNFMGCLSGAEPDMLDAHEEGLMKMFCDEYERYGGPHLDWRELLLRYRLQWPSYVVDCCQWIERDILRECPVEEWKNVSGKTDDIFVGRWNVRCRGTSLINAFEFWPRRNFAKIFEEFKNGVGKPFISDFTA